MSQSFANTNSFTLELGLGAPRTEGWAWPKFAFRFEPFKGYSRFLRYPGSDDGLSYRMIRVATIVVLQVKARYF